MAKIPLNRVKRNGKVDLWDMGPQNAPVAPTAPAEPDAKLKGAELAAAQVEHEDALIAYKAKLRDYIAARNAFRDWKTLNGGPIKVEFWGVDAGHAIDTDPARYKLDLPRGTQPGQAQVEADARAKAEREELERAAALDPQFGNQAGAAA